MTGERVTVGPFEWERRDNGGYECWDLVQTPGLPMTHWAVKNYGGKPNTRSGFSGWRLVSGGPFTEAGGWTSRDDAMQGVIPWLICYYRRELQRRLAEAERLSVTLANVLRDFEGRLQ